MMAKILMLEKYKGEIDNEFIAVHIATDINMNRFKTYNLALKKEGDRIVNDIENTKWSRISEVEYRGLVSALHCTASENYLVNKSIVKHEMSDQKKNQGFSR